MRNESDETHGSDESAYILFYDGECPLCRREVDWLCRRAPTAVRPIDIAAEGFDAADYGLKKVDVHRELHGIKADGTVTIGMDSVREAYRAIGLGALVAFTKYWPFRPATDWAYQRFAANRVTIGSWLGRAKCGGDSCESPPDPPLG